jgi:hypothetical protein
VIGLLLVASGIAGPFLTPGRASDWCLAVFLVTLGLAGFLSGVQPLLGPDAKRLAGPAGMVCAAIATAAGIASLWLGERDTMVVLWVVVAGATILFWGMRMLRRQIKR